MRDKIPNLTDYEKTYREFNWEIPEYYNFGFDGFDRWAEDRTKLALISVDDTGIHAVRHTLDRSEEPRGGEEERTMRRMERVSFLGRE